jgi:hypothetical protein
VWNVRKTDKVCIFISIWVDNFRVGDVFVKDVEVCIVNVSLNLFEGFSTQIYW